MKVIIQLTRDQEAKALPILLRHSPGMILPYRTYLLYKEALKDLQVADIQFSEVSREAVASSSGAILGRLGRRKSPFKA